MKIGRKRGDQKSGGVSFVEKRVGTIYGEIEILGYASAFDMGDSGLS